MNYKMDLFLLLLNYNLEIIYGDVKAFWEFFTENILKDLTEMRQEHKAGYIKKIMLVAFGHCIGIGIIYVISLLYHLVFEVKSKCDFIIFFSPVIFFTENVIFCSDHS